MGGLRLRTKFLLSMVAVSVALTFTTLFAVRRTVQKQVRAEIHRDLQNSVSAFRNVQKQREVTLERSAALLADLPNTRALMTTHDPATIQDASRDLWMLAGSDVLLLADPAGKVMAQQATPKISPSEASAFISSIVRQAETRHWWLEQGHLYEVFLQDIYFGPAAGRNILGYLVIGYEIDDRVARELSQVAAGEVVFGYGDSIARSTLNPALELELQRQLRASPETVSGAGELWLGREQFLVTSVDLSGGSSAKLRLWVLKSFDQATAFIRNLNELLLGLGLAAVLGGSILVFFLSHTFTRPLADLVSGVRALGQGDFAYPLAARGSDEVAEVTRAFDRMRQSLQATQRELLDAERLATIGRMASSISHDVRHALAAMVANAEFLCESDLTAEQREDLYAEIRVAVKQMTDLMESLLEFSRTREALHPSFGDVREAVDSAIKIVRAHPDFHQVSINVVCQGRTEGWFDFKKLERAILNLLLNACEVVPPGRGKIDVDLKRAGECLEVRVRDNGPGIAEAVRDKLFEPFVSHGKENGTGMGLTVVQKIVQDHGGEVTVERTSEQGTIFRMNVPLSGTPESAMAVKDAS